MGITAAIGAGLTGLGVGASTAGILAPALLGAGIGAGTSALTGGDPGVGALTGGLSLGLAGGLGGTVGSTLGIGAEAGGALAGAAGGALGSAIGGGDPLTGAVSGGIGGYLSAPGAPAAGAGTATTGAIPNAGQVVGGPTSVGVTGQAISDFAPSTNSLLTNFDAATQVPGAALGSVAGPVATSGVIAGTNLASTGGGGGAAASTGGMGTSIDNLIHNPTGGNLWKAVEANPGVALNGLGMLYSASQQGGLPPEAAQLKAQAEALASKGNELTSYLFSGQLPPGAKAQLDKATSSAKAAIKSQYANLGISGSTMEADALSQVDQQAAGMVFNITNDMLKTGLNATGLSSQLYQALLGTETARDKDLSDSIANFALAAGGGYRLPTGGGGQGGGVYYPARA